MAILINVKTPKACLGCLLRDGVSCRLNPRILNLGAVERPSKCPLIEVPDSHGRLIDADAFKEFVDNRFNITWKNDYEGGIKDACVDILEEIEKMPTVVPANEED